MNLVNLFHIIEYLVGLKIKFQNNIQTTLQLNKFHSNILKSLNINVNKTLLTSHSFYETYKLNFKN